MLMRHLKRIALVGVVGVGTWALPARAEDKPAPDKPAPTAKVEAAKIGEGDAHKEAGMVELFNGKDLVGWEGTSDFWSVQDGAIRGQTTAEKPTKGNTFLVYTKKNFENFELHFKYKIESGNSGVQYRSKVLDPKSYRVGGYQGDFEFGTKFSGIVYDEAGVAGGRGVMADRGTKVTYTADGQKQVEKLPMSSDELQKAIKQGEWNDYTIIADGNHLTHKINGNVTSEVIDQSPKALKSGVLALQLHAGAPMTVYFKDLHLKPLGDKGEAGDAKAGDDAKAGAEKKAGDK